MEELHLPGPECESLGFHFSASRQHERWTPGHRSGCMGSSQFQHPAPSEYRPFGGKKGEVRQPIPCSAGNLNPCIHGSVRCQSSFACGRHLTFGDAMSSTQLYTISDILLAPRASWLELAHGFKPGLVPCPTWGQAGDTEEVGDTVLLHGTWGRGRGNQGREQYWRGSFCMCCGLSPCGQGGGLKALLAPSPLGGRRNYHKSYGINTLRGVAVGVRVSKEKGGECHHSWRQTPWQLHVASDPERA